MACQASYTHYPGPGSARKPLEAFPDLRRSNRSTRNDVGLLSYDQKHHPMDDMLQPWRVKKRKQAHRDSGHCGLAREPQTRDNEDEDKDDQDEFEHRDDTTSGHWPARQSSSSSRHSLAPYWSSAVEISAEQDTSSLAQPPREADEPTRSTSEAEEARISINSLETEQITSTMKQCKPTAANNNNNAATTTTFHLSLSESSSSTQTSKWTIFLNQDTDIAASAYKSAWEALAEQEDPGERFERQALAYHRAWEAWDVSPEVVDGSAKVVADEWTGLNHMENQAAKRTETGNLSKGSLRAVTERLGKTHESLDDGASRRNTTSTDGVVDMSAAGNSSDHRERRWKPKSRVRRSEQDKPNRMRIGHVTNGPSSKGERSKPTSFDIHEDPGRSAHSSPLSPVLLDFARQAGPVYLCRENPKENERQSSIFSDGSAYSDVNASVRDHHNHTGHETYLMTYQNTSNQARWRLHHENHNIDSVHSSQKSLSDLSAHILPMSRSSTPTEPEIPNAAGKELDEINSVHSYCEK